jgi:purine-binding chemotaxis protein CheW
MASRAQPKADVAPSDTARKILIFQLAGSSFGLELSAVAEIIRMPDLAHMPLVPPSLIGLVNLRGVVMPVISLRRVLHLADDPTNELTRVIVMRGDAPVGFVVDRVDHLLAVQADQFETNETGAGTVDPALLDGAIKGAEREGTIKILDPQRLLNGQFGQLGVSGVRSSTRAAVSAGTSTTSTAPVQAQVSLVSFDVGQQEYALPLDRVREIIALPDHIAEFARSEAAVLGVITLRERLLPLVSLRALLGLPAAVESERGSKVVVVSVREAAVGVVADATREILHVASSAIDPAPTLLTRGEGDAEIVSICRLDNGKRLVALLSPDRLFRADVVRRIMGEQVSGPVDSSTITEESAMADEQYIVFRLGGQDYGMPIGAVSEIARKPEHITRLPKAPAFIDGVMNLRGGVVPIVDLGRRFDLAVAERAGTQRILVLEVGGVRAGFMVDSVSEVLKVPASAVCAAPELSPDQARLISRVVNLEAEGRMILLVDPTQLLSQIETDVLTKFEPSKLDQNATDT